MIATVTRIPAASCPSCRASLSAAHLARGVGGPKEGDLTVCAYCLGVLEFGAALQLRAITEAELETQEAAVRLGIDNARRMLHGLQLRSPQAFGSARLGRA